MRQDSVVHPARRGRSCAPHNAIILAMLLVTGGAGFIGSNFVLSTIAETGEAVVNLDKLTYAGNVRSLDGLRGDTRHVFVQGDICDRDLVKRVLQQYKPRAVVHFAAESHVD